MSVVVCVLVDLSWSETCLSVSELLTVIMH